MTGREILGHMFADGITARDCTTWNMSWLGDTVNDVDVILAYIHMRRMPEVAGLTRDNGSIVFRLKDTKADESVRTSVFLRLVAALHGSHSDEKAAFQYLSEHPERVVNAALVNTDILQQWLDRAGSEVCRQGECTCLYLDMSTTPKLVISSRSEVPSGYIVIDTYERTATASAVRFEGWKTGERFRLEDKLVLAVRNYYLQRGSE